jgi:dTDP-4-amino-4,6-dideoxygalactose transaminase
MEVLPMFLHQKRLIAEQYKAFFADTQYSFVEEPSYAKSNYWLNAVICPDSASRDRLLKETNEAGVMTRPVWKLMHRLPMFESSPRGDLTVSEWVEARLVNIPSSPISLEV